MQSCDPGYARKLSYMSERRRFVGPDSSVRPIFATEAFPQVTLESILDLETLARHDGRFPEQMRAFNIRSNVISPAAGSCYLEVGGTKLTCAVYGPRGTGKMGKTYLDEGNIYCEVDLLPFASSKRRPYHRESEEQELSRLLQETLEAVVRRETFPNSVLDVYINVIEDDGGVLAAAITASSVAISLAGIQQTDSLVACSMLCVHNHVLLDPSFGEEYCNEITKLTMAISANHQEIAQIYLIGNGLEEVVLREATSLATEACSAIYEQIKPVLLASSQE